MRTARRRHVAVLVHLGDAGKTASVTRKVVIGSPFVPLSPKRLLDIRNGTGAPVAPLAAGTPLSVNVLNAPGAPSNTPVRAVVLNVTATGSTAGGYVTVYPDGSPAPTASNINFSTGETVPKMVTVGLGDTGKIDFTNRYGSVNVVADLFGYFTAR